MNSFFSSKDNQAFWNELLPTGCLIATTYPQFDIVNVNAELARMLGYADAAALERAAGGSMLTFVHPDDLARVMQAAPLQTGKFDVYEIDYRMLCGSGGYRWIKQKSKHFMDNDGRELIAATFMDVTEGIHAVRVFQEFVDNLPGGVFHYADDEEMYMDYVSPHFYTVLGYTRKEFEEKYHHRFCEMIYHEDRARVIEEINKQMETSDYDICEYRVEKKDGTLIWLSDAGHRVTGEDGRKCFYVVVVDISQSHLLRQALEKASLASKAKGDFLSRMSHDIRTPMNAIMGLTALALEEPNLTPAVEQYLSEIGYSGRFLLGLLNDILDVSKIENGNLTLQRQRYELAEFRQIIRAMIEPLCKEKNITFRFIPGETSFPVLVDKVRFNQIFINLLSNAVKYTPAGGDVAFLVENDRVADGVLHCDFVIRDNGIGMSEEFMQHMFEPFTQEDAATVANYCGTGLGLTIVQSLVTLMHGTLHIDSAPGKGTTVRLGLSMPIDTAEPQPATDGTENCTVKLDGKRILVADDHPLNLEIVKKILTRRGMLVVEAPNGQEAVRSFKASPVFGIDAILMDIRMPVMNGLEAAEAIRAMERADAATVPIIAVTANAFDEDVERSAAAGMTAHLSKPIVPELLLAALQKHLS